MSEKTDHYTLYGGDISYYTGKALSYLRYKGIPFDYLQATRDVYKEVIVPSVGWPVIPVVRTPEGDILQDTSDIIDQLEVRFPDQPIFPAGPRQRVIALLLEVYGDEWLKLPAMHYRWNHNLDWIIREFGRLSAPQLDEAGQREVGERTCRPFRGSLPMLGVTENTFHAVEASYEALLGELDAHFAQHDFLFGSRPSIGDYGLIGPLYAHQYRDPASGALMDRLAPHLVKWVLRMMTPEPLSGEFLADDEVPETIVPIVRRMMRELQPVALDTMTAVAQWASEHPDEMELPRGIGMHTFTLEAGLPGEAREQRAILPFLQWMWQRPLDAYAALDTEAQAAVNVWLAEAAHPDQIKRQNVLEVQPGVRVERRNYKLEVVRS